MLPEPHQWFGNVWRLDSYRVAFGWSLSPGNSIQGITIFDVRRPEQPVYVRLRGEARAAAPTRDGRLAVVTEEGLFFLDLESGRRSPGTYPFPDDGEAYMVPLPRD